MKTNAVVSGDKLYMPMEKSRFTLSVDSYSSLDEKSNYWSNKNENPHLDYHRIDKIEEFVPFYDALSANKNCIFRGVNEAKFKLFTSLQIFHILNSLPITPRQFVANEIEELKNANEKLYPRYFKSMSTDETDFLYLSLLQHYFAKTPFLDFSYSLNKALFFAQDRYRHIASDKDINNYISLYWIDLSEENGFEFIDIIQWYANQLRHALDQLKNIYETHPDVDINTNILNWDNYLLWSNPDNMGEGINKIELGFITDKRDPLPHKTTKEEYNQLLTDFKRDASSGKLKSNPALLQQYYNSFYSALIQNVKLTNLNIIAQEGCFLLYNPENSLIPLEDYWSHNPTYLHLPTLHCLDICKKLIKSQIQSRLKAANISTETVYPIETDIVVPIADKAAFGL